MKTFGNILLTVLTILLAAALCAATLFSAASAGVRSAFTPDAVYELTEGMDYASLMLPDGFGGFAPLCEIINQSLGGLGLTFSPAELNSAVRTFSIDAVISSFAQDFRAWMLDNGPVPALDSGEMARTVLSGLDSRVTGLLGLFGDPAAMLAGLLDNVTESARLGERLSVLEPIREALSRGTLIFALSVCAALFLLILVCRRLRLFRAVVWAGISCAASGTLLILAERLAQPYKNHLLAELAMPESTLDLLYRPLMDELHRFGSVMALAGLTVAVFAGLIVLFGGMIRREKQRAEAEKEARYTGFPVA